MQREWPMLLLIVIFIFGIGLEARFYFQRRVVESGARAAASAAPTASCLARDLRLRLPLDGRPDHDWVIANYFDQDPSAGQVRDYTGATGEQALTYDGHSGVDFEIPGFRQMDQGVRALASADGVVEETYDQSPDRNRTCSNEKWNFVKLRHANGFATLYGHLRQGSLLVHVGDRVSAGQAVGLVGSSGCSSYPHVHLEVVDCQGRALDALQEHLFTSEPPYSGRAEAALMEMAVFSPVLDSVLRIQDPDGESLMSVARNQDFSVGLTVSHLKRGDRVRIEFLKPDNSLAPFFFESTNGHDYPRTHWWGDFKLDQNGSWLIVVKINEREIGSRALQVL